MAKVEGQTDYSDRQIFVNMARANFKWVKSTGEIADRKQRIVFVGAILGLIFNNLLMALYLWGGEDTALLWILNTNYNVILAAIAVAAYRNFHVMRVAVIGMILVYLLIWVRTFYDASNGEESFVNIPVLFFSPIAMALVSSYRVMALVAVTQPLLLFFHARYFGQFTYAAGWTQDELMQYSSAIALVSFVSCLLLAAIAFLREQTDYRVQALLAEKDALAAEDPLTGLENRRSFLKAMSSTLTGERSIACAFIDLDRFKPLNDEYGHRVGDRVLRTIGKRLLRNDKIIAAARLGGDEFAVLVDVTRIAGPLDDLIKDLHHSITEDVVTQVGLVGVDASVGFAVYPEDAKEQSALMHCADTAMRRAKTERLETARFKEGVDTASISYASLEIALRDALRFGRIRPALQPVACAVTGQVLGFEILARWIDSGLARDPLPVDFIPLAEKSGLLNGIMLTTLDQALQSYPLEQGQFLAVNVSPSQLTSAEFLDEIEALLRRYNMHPGQLELEITEQVAFRNLDRNLEMLNLAQARGFSIALDDFGVGYSSLAMLNSLPLNKIKIDRSFVQRSNSAGTNFELLEATIALIKKLGLTCCIEGVEDSKTSEHVAQLGCDQMQGFWIGRPELIEASPLRAA